MNKEEMKLMTKAMRYQDAMDKIDALFSFFNRNYKAQSEIFKKQEEKYAIGLKINHKLKELFKNNNPDEKFLQDTKDFLITNSTKLSDIIELNYNAEKKTISFSLKSQYNKKTYNPIVARDEMIKCNNGWDILYVSTLSNLIIIFENYLKSVYCWLIINNPSKYFENKQIPLIKIFKTRHLVFEIINDEVEKALYDSLGCLDNILEKNSINLDAFGKIKDSFIEIYHRRNLFVHNNGIVNETYLSKVKYMDKKLCEGVKIDTDYEYVERSFLVVAKIISCISFNVEKIIKKESTDAYDELECFAFNCLSNSRYEMSQYIFEMLKSDKNLEFAQRLNYECNYLNSLKHLNIDIKKHLKQLDVSATSDNYKIAKYCLSDENEKAYELLNQSYPNSFSAKEIRDWPIFIDFRKTDYFTRFVNSHKDDFVEYDYINDSKEITDECNEK